MLRHCLLTFILLGTLLLTACVEQSPEVVSTPTAEAVNTPAAVAALEQSLSEMAVCTDVLPMMAQGLISQAVANKQGLSEIAFEKWRKNTLPGSPLLDSLGRVREVAPDGRYEGRNFGGEPLVVLGDIYPGQSDETEPVVIFTVRQEDVPRLKEGAELSFKGSVWFLAEGKGSGDWMLALQDAEYAPAED